MDFQEYLVKRKLGTAEKAVTVLLYVAAFFFMLCCVVYLRFGGVESLLAVAGYWGAYILASRLKKEFEYVCTEHLVDIDVIFNESKRKSLISFSVKKVEILASVKDDMYKHLLNGQFDSVIDATTWRKDATVYFAVLEKEGKRVLVKFEPPLKCLEYLKAYAPSKVKIYTPDFE